MSRNAGLFFAALCAALLLVRAPARSQEGNVTIEHADSLVGMEIDGEKARSLVGAVRFTQGKVIVTCDKAVQFLASRRLTMEGNVEVRDDSTRLVCDRGTYDPGKRLAEGFGRVMMEDPTTVLHADYGRYATKEKVAFFSSHVIVQDTASVLTANELTYDRTTKHITADGNVILVNDRNGLTATGGHFEHFQASATSVMSVHPKVVTVDSSADGTKDTLEIYGRVVEMVRDSLPRVTVTDSVRIFRGSMAAEAGSTVMFTERDSIILRKSPVVWYRSDAGEENQISGDSILLGTRGHALDNIRILGRAVAVSQSDSLHPERLNQLTGQEITMRFADKKLARIDVERTATSLYFLFDGTTPNGLNRTTGDRVTMTFTDGQIDEITFRTDVQGTHIPERLVKGRLLDFTLDGVRWRPRVTRPGSIPSLK
jgi:lipopolysaccharide export system protein LptA